MVNHGCKAKPVRLTGGLVHSATANLEFCSIHNRVVVHANATSKVVNETVLSARIFEQLAIHGKYCQSCCRSKISHHAGLHLLMHIVRLSQQNRP